ncbi:MAG: RNA polymerase sigma factor RpoD/SigA [Candidatus Latescibacterota bacterium]
MEAQARSKRRRGGKNRPFSTGDRTLDMYLDSIGGAELLSAEEETRLMLQAQQGDAQARNQLIEANLRFVVSVATEYQNRGVPLGELISSGNMGLLKAVERFDLSKGCKFITYAVWWVRQAITETLIEHSPVRLPVNQYNLMNKIVRTYSDLQQGEELALTEETARLVGCSEEKIVQALHLWQSQGSSLDEPLTPGEEGSMLDQLADWGQPSPEEEMDRDAMRQSVAGLFGLLSEREVEVVRLYFGFETGEPMTLQEIGDRFNLTRERIRQIKEKALRKMRTPQVSSMLRGYLDDQMTCEPEYDGAPASPAPRVRAA